MKPQADELPSVSRCAVRELIDRYAAEHPSMAFATFAWDRPDWSWAEMRVAVRSAAGVLRALGVRQGDHVAMWLPNGPEALQAWFAVNYLGAVVVPLNQAYRGRLLEHAIALSDARVMFVHPGLLDRLDEVALSQLEVLLVRGGGRPPRPGVAIVDPDTAPIDRDLTLERELAPWDPQSIIFTSGTTGPSKGVIVTYAQMYFTSTKQRAPMGPQDRQLLHAPLFHVAGMGSVFRALVVGGSVGVLERFNTATFWSDVRRVGATRATIFGSMASFLLTLPVSDDERLTPLESVVVAPLSPENVALAKRAGVNWSTTFNMTEASLPIISDLNPEKVGVCGRPRAGIDARVVDEHDVERPRGEVGELILRSDTPWALTPGYYKDPAATARAWRNGWFHTGDAFRVDEDGDFVFVDRLKDAIRRRGENISSFEVEAEVSAHPAIEECAAVAVPSEHGEDEVLVVIQPVAGEEISPPELLVFLQPRMAHFMLPRYVRVMESLPRTPTYKVQKHILRAEGVTTDTWDREAAGFKVARDRIGIGA